MHKWKVDLPLIFWCPIVKVADSTLLLHANADLDIDVEIDTRNFTSNNHHQIDNYRNTFNMSASSSMNCIFLPCKICIIVVQ